MKQGFTLVELLMVVLIIGLLASAGLPEYTRAIERARMAEAKQMLADIYNAKKMARVTLRRDPTSFAEMDVKFPTENGAVATGGTFNTKNFTYGIQVGVEGNCGSRNPAPVRADSRNEPYLLYFCPGKLQCIERQAGTCRKMGFSSAQTEGCISEASCFVE